MLYPLSYGGVRLGYLKAVNGQWVEGAEGSDGGDEGDRTPDLRIANAALSQLSYIPIRPTSIGTAAPQSQRD